jgi:hypothetical protein
VISLHRRVTRCVRHAARTGGSPSSERAAPNRTTWRYSDRRANRSIETPSFLPSATRPGAACSGSRRFRRRLAAVGAQPAAPHLPRCPRPEKSRAAPGLVFQIWRNARRRPTAAPHVARGTRLALEVPRRVNARHPTEQPGGTQTAARTALSKLLPSFLPRHDPSFCSGRVVSGLRPRRAGGAALVLARRGSHAFARPSSGSAAPSSASPGCLVGLIARVEDVFAL